MKDDLTLNYNHTPEADTATPPYNDTPQNPPELPHKENSISVCLLDEAQLSSSFPE